MKFILSLSFLLSGSVAFSPPATVPRNNAPVPPLHIQSTKCHCQTQVDVMTRTYSTTTLRMSSDTDASSVPIDTSILVKVREGVEEAAGDLEEWNTCVSLLSNNALDGGLLLEADEAEYLLAKAHRWRAWATARSDLTRKFVKTSLPKVEELQATLNWFSEGPLQILSSDQLLTALRAFPETYLIAPETTYQKALQVAPKEYREDPSIFHNLIMERPEALQFTVNCEDTGCQSECGSCWVTNANR